MFTQGDKALIIPAQIKSPKVHLLCISKKKINGLEKPKKPLYNTCHLIQNWQAILDYYLWTRSHVSLTVQILYYLHIVSDEKCNQIINYARKCSDGIQIPNCHLCYMIGYDIKKKSSCWEIKYFDEWNGIKGPSIH